MLRGIDIKKEIPLNKKYTNYLFTIGIDQYKCFPKLFNAVRDVNDFSSLLFQKYEFKKENHISLINEKATEKNIYETFRSLINLMTAEDSLLIYFSGHGHYDEVFKLGYWIPVDAHPEDNGDFISNLDIANFLRQLKSHHTFLIADSCFSGSLISQNRGHVAIKKAEGHPSCRIFTSGRNEVVQDGTPGEYSPFAKALITSMRSNQELYLSATSIIELVKSEVNSKIQQEAIDGRLRDSKDKNGEFVFWAKSSEDKIWSEQINKTNLQSLKKYISIYTEGKYTSEAIALIHQLEEDVLWKKANQEKSGQLLFQYTAQYPNGKYKEIADEQLNEINAKEEERRKRMAAAAERQNKIEAARDQYAIIIKRAEAFFKTKDYKQARKFYRRGLLENYIENESFAPGRNYVSEKISKCDNAILFYNYLEHGRSALSNELYPLALDYLTKAKQIQHTEQVNNLISACQREIDKTKGGRLTKNIPRKKIKIRSVENKTPKAQVRSHTTTNQHYAVPRAKPDHSFSTSSRKKDQNKSKRFILVILGVVFLIFTITIILNQGRQNLNNNPKRSSDNTTIPNTRPAGPTGVVTARKLVLRNYPSTLVTKSSSIIEVLKGTKLRIIDQRPVDDGLAARQLRRGSLFYSEKNTDRTQHFNSGKAVTWFQTWNDTYSLVAIEFKIGDVQRGYIKTDDLSILGSNIWYQVDYNGQKYWGIGKYISKN